MAFTFFGPFSNFQRICIGRWLWFDALHCLTECCCCCWFLLPSFVRVVTQDFPLHCATLRFTNISYCFVCWTFFIFNFAHSVLSPAPAITTLHIISDIEAESSSMYRHWPHKWLSAAEAEKQWGIWNLNDDDESQQQQKSREKIKIRFYTRARARTIVFLGTCLQNATADAEWRRRRRCRRRQRCWSWWK